MNYKKVIDQKLTELKKRKENLEKDYDELLPVFTKKGRELENHESYTRVLNVTYSEIQKINEQIEILREIKIKAQK